MICLVFITTQLIFSSFFYLVPTELIVLAAAMLLRATRGRYIPVKHLSFIKKSCIMKYLCFWKEAIVVKLQFYCYK